MLLAVVLGLILGVVGRILLLQWADGVLAEKRPKALFASASLDPSAKRLIAASATKAARRRRVDGVTERRRIIAIASEQ